MNRLSKLTLLAALTLFLCACGQRGPLYLPEQAPSNEPAPENPVQPPEVRTTDGEQ
ncbi:MAG: putative small lipoprotein YifL [Glaciecola sp.]|jgi:predicted small lipoprotein YifL